MSAPTITFDIDGEQVTARDATWYEIAPCGCTSGAHLVSTGIEDHGVTLTEADAWAAFYEGMSEQMRRHKALGFRMELGRRADVVERLVDCPHDPKWGVPVAPIPEGYVWAATDAMPRQRDRRHLIAGVRERDRTYLSTTGWKEQTVALCGRAAYQWSTFWATEQTAECRTCEAAARRLVARGVRVGADS